jgi:RNA polymerase sigma factor (sigma-70 family)
VLAAGEQDKPQSTAALEQLCRTYWYPLYAYVRRRGYSPENAQDLTQGFFALLLARRSLASVAPGRGRFRCFLLVALKRFLVNQRERAEAAKRGGSKTHIFIDGRAAEERYGVDASEQNTPDKLFDRAWGLSIMEAASQHLEEEYRLVGQDRLFDVLKPLLGGNETETTYTAIGAMVGLSEGAVKMTILRMRRRFRALLREEVAQTVSSVDHLDDEMRSLREIFYG